MSRARELSRVGSLTGISTITGVIHADQANSRFKVGSGVTMTTSGDIVAAGVITATSFVGDGSGITNAGSTLSAGSGSQRLVLTSQTTGAMTATATSVDLTFDSTGGDLTVGGGISAGGNSSITGNLDISGDLTVTGTLTAPTASAGTNTTQVATTEFVSTAVANVIDSAPGALDTLNELAAALGDDANFSSSVTNSLALKAPLASPALTGTPTAPTAAADTDTTQVATTAYVQTELLDLDGGNVTSGTVDVARLGSGTPSASNFLRGDGAWTAVPSPNDGTLTLATSGTGLSGSATFTADDASNVTFTVTSNATSANTALAIVARDASGNFAAQEVQVDSFGVGTAASGTTGEIRATNDITAFYSSDERLKENIVAIPDALAKLEAISGNTFDWREGFGEFHSHEGADCGVIAQEIEALGIPGLVTTRESGYKAVKYEKLTALLIEAVKELSGKVKHLEERCNCGQAHN
jgi:hypothetical protein